MRFVAVHPVVFPEEQLQPLTKETLPEGVIWESTYCSFPDNKTFCVWTAPAKESVVAILKKYEIPYETIHVVRHFDPATGVLEPESIEEKVPQPV
jgi:hypothetical protein